MVWRSPEALNDGWYNICVTYDQGTARLYVDGEFKQLASIGSSGATSSKPLVIGSGLQGLITDVVIYNQKAPDERCRTVYTLGTETKGFRAP